MAAVAAAAPFSNEPLHRASCCGFPRPEGDPPCTMYHALRVSPVCDLLCVCVRHVSTDLKSAVCVRVCAVWGVSV